MKLYRLTNIKTGKVVRTNATEAEIAALRKAPKNPGGPVDGPSMLSLYTVEEFEVEEGKTFLPDFIKNNAAAAATKEETKGLPAGEQTT